jgi:hypothetical protein
MKLEIFVLQYLLMATRNRSQFQIDSTDEIRQRAKVVAIEHGFKTLSEFIHDALIKQNDPKLTTLVHAYLANKRQPGREPKQK